VAERKRCAIYTRKSTEEGLEQDFNSLDAQREACAAYILSQAAEGWEQVDEHYDDGGWSGGRMERPALKQLLTHVEAGKVDIIVVYKVDRLTRSLADFAKIVDILDAKEASFVSVTQAFNTTNSMGRLTLNVLLSFAQFEREVTGERIRDKIAASKKKGMWMGGPVPLGYDARERRLCVNEYEAATVRHIFKRYTALQSIPKLIDDLAASDHRTRKRVMKSSRETGGVKFAAGPLSHILRNRIYLGEVSHKGTSYPGEHEAIIEQSLFDQVQQILATNRRDHSIGRHLKVPGLLKGMITDPGDRPMMPTHSLQGSKRYRYYITRLKPGDDKSSAIRVPAHELEQLIMSEISAQLLNWQTDGSCDAEQIEKQLEEAKAFVERLNQPSVLQQREALLDLSTGINLCDESVKLTFKLPSDSRSQTIDIVAKLVRRGSDLRIASTPGKDGPIQEPDPVLVRLVTHGFAAQRHLVENEPCELVESYTRRHLNRLVKISYLAPDIISSIISGTQPPDLTGRKLLRMANLPIDWAEQRGQLGF
jgi:site-specific DNA recombinase